jgi:hypothetical protein
MSKQTGLGDNFYIGGYDISGDVSAIQKASMPIALLEETGIDKSAIERVYGLRGGELDVALWFNDANTAGGDPTNQEHWALKGLPLTDVIACYFRGLAIGSPAACLVGKQVDYDWTRGANGSLAGKVQVLNNAYPLEWCEQLTAGKRVDTAATAGAGLDSGAVASGAFGLSAYIQVFAMTGTDLTVKLQHCDTDTPASYTDIAGGGFTQILGAGFTPTVQRIQTAAITIKRWVRVVSTTAGGVTSCTFAVAYDRYWG